MHDDDDLHHDLQQTRYVRQHSAAEGTFPALQARVLRMHGRCACAVLTHTKDRARLRVGRSHTLMHVLSAQTAQVSPIAIALDTPVTPWKGQHIYTVTRPDLYKAWSTQELARILMD